jgi:membrane associated rhomboid family serine protease
MGHIRFLFFYVICGLVAVATHYVTHRGDVTPVVGASGALAGVMAAYLRLFPMARIQCLFWFIIIIRVIEVPAMAVIVLWFVSQLMSILGDSVGNVAWYAHIGGFVAGSWLTTRWFPHQSFRFMRW